jgi:large repetitive protein
MPIMRRLISALLSAMLLAGLLPLHALADAAIAVDQSVSVTEDVAQPITLAATGGDGALTFSVAEQPLHGSLTGTEPDLTYTPAANYSGPDSFTFKANDGTVDSNTATVSINVTPVNDPPVANDDPDFACGSGAFGGSFPIPEDYAFGPQPPGLECSLNFNDTDVEGDALTFELVTQAAHGTAMVASDGSWSYTPDADFFTPILDYQSDSFTYRAFDGTDWSAPATMWLWIAPVNDAPSFASGGDVTVNEDSGPYAAGWASAISPGPGESGQAVDFVIEDVTNPSLFAMPPAISSTGVLSFVPAANWYGSSTVTVHAHDNGGLEDYGPVKVSPANASAPRTFTITVSQVNDAPTPAATSASLNEDAGPWLIPVSAVDVEGDPTTLFAVATPAAHGLVETTPGITCSPPGTCAGAFLYTPAANYNGLDTFTFTASDGSATSAPASVSITVLPVNDAPVANAQSVTTNEDTAKAITLAGTDVDGNTLTFAIVDNPAHGSLSGTGSARTYTPAANYNGPDAFTFKANDGSVDSNTATVTIDVSPVNDAPVASAQSVTTNEDTAKAIALTASDVEGSTLTYTVVTGPAHGTLSGTGSARTYTPAANFNGADSFTFRANDGLLDSNIATVSITVSAVNDRPVCSPLALGTDKNVPVNGTVTCADIESPSLTLRLETGPAKGTVNPFNTTTGAFTYTPHAGATGPDSFTVIASDGADDSAPVTVDVTIGNHAPVAEAQAVTTGEDTAKAITLAGTDVDLDVLTYTVVTGPAHGTLTGTGPARTYTPAANFNGADSFTFRANDGLLDSNIATVSITVSAVNDAPIADVLTVSTREDTPAAIILSGSDVEGSALTYEVVDGPAHGALSGTGSARTYTSAANFNGADSFTFRVNDGLLDSNIATVSITVDPVNDAPVARTDGFTVRATTTSTLTVLANDYSAPVVSGITSEPADTITVQSVGNAARGRVSIVAGGTAVSYDPIGCGTGGDSFTYTIVDGGGLTATATAFVTIARPGTNGLSVTPITDTPSLGFITGSTVGSAVPARLSWCGVPRSGYSVRSYTVGQSANGGSSYASTPIIRGTTARSSTRTLAVGTTYRWRARTTDSAGRTGSYRYSLASRVGRYQENSAALTYSGTWGTKRSTSYSGGAQRSTKAAGATATITLTNARQFAIVGPRSSSRGSFGVYVDGTLVATVSEKATTAVYRRVLYVRSLTSGSNVQHTIQLRAVGNGQVDLDAVLALF